MLHADLIHDDDWAVAGTSLAASDFPDGGDLVIEREVDGRLQLPQLRDVIVAVFDTVVADVGLNSRLRLQPNNYPESKTLTGFAEAGQLILTDSGAATVNAGCVPPLRRKLPGKLDLQLSKSLNWINPGNSTYFATTANEDGIGILYQSVGRRIGVPEGGRKLAVVKAAGGDQTAADTWSGSATGQGGFKELLSDESPGTDPDQLYVLAALGLTPEAVSDDLNLAVRLRATGSPECYAVAPASGDVVEHCMTEFTYDSVMGRGDGVWHGQSYAAAVNTPNFEFELLEGTGGGGGGVVPPVPPGGRVGFQPPIFNLPRLPGLGSGIRLPGF